MPEAFQHEPAPTSGRVWLLTDERGAQELVFAFPLDERLNEAVKQLPGRWFDWRRKHWRVPADPRIGKDVEALLGGSRSSTPSPTSTPG